ncbi:MAG TPA: VWA domain-containing protein [Blastocatellia bacterium]|nr:VWA domain-containing protein [Blastocatellia bacterium]
MWLPSLIISFVLLPCMIALAGASGASALIGQSSPQTKPAPKSAQDQDEVIRLSSRLVVVPVAASDAAGRPVRDLKVEDFVIEEDGLPQRPIALGEPGETPVEIALLLDVSSSIHGQFAFEQQAAVRFIKDVLKTGDAVSVFSIGLVPKIVQARTTSGEEAIAGLLSMRPLKEPTAFFDAVVQAALYLGKAAEAGSRRVLVVISDGEENYSAKYMLADTLRELQLNDCLFYSINPSGPGIRLNRVSLKGQGFMETMSSQTGGKAFLPAGVEDLEAVFRQIADELQVQYLFGYYSTDERTDGGFRRITVRTPKRPELRIRARQGYYVPKT